MSLHGSVAERMAYTSLGLANYNEITTTVAARKQRRKSFLLAILPLFWQHRIINTILHTIQHVQKLPNVRSHSAST
jgi:hypothetical protein